MGAICKYCNQDMTEVKGCVKIPVKCADGTVLGPIPYGDPREHMPSDMPACPDCAAKHGGFHHPGCDWETCPKCGGQLISCGCLEGNEEEEN